MLVPRQVVSACVVGPCVAGLCVEGAGVGEDCAEAVGAQAGTVIESTAASRAAAVLLVAGIGVPFEEGR
ncbi:hypothetical protein AOZ06_15975 [Kibdelosporangium phytohabitans]|uniref:Uncharacterized protein n=1 Tax=Kibdelosporangium phytohabitans TaxID=860235 RepID=A0A0N7F3C0_9PSEU|nr:hypothetical protein AOZ06_15975 [Kibdelosporangium phytohabitans]